MEGDDVVLKRLPEISCDYCHINLEGERTWETVFEADKQYAVHKCGCGKHKWMNVGLEGFDPRDFFSKQNSTVESAFPKVFEREG
ncbi:hypothetical protein HOA92_01680 [archaeon]|nr:hypothetical protein [archaeon]MBT6761723.1 hypothetical protein [archaeon]